MELSPYQQYIHMSRYARYRDDLGRRETWSETVDRVRAFWHGRFPQAKSEIDEAMDGVQNMEVMPSMRIMMTAGPALDEHEVSGYNCAYLPIDSVRSFSDVLYILMCGTGVGFSVERTYVKQLPILPEEFHDSDTVIKVRDSKLGWTVAYKELLQLLFGGRVPSWDTSGVRAAGARLKTFGGRASGPAPLEALFRFTIETFRAAAGRQLTTLECHDLVCKVADIVVVGGVRRSALISLSNLTDDRMRTAKSGMIPAHRYLANNSVAYTVKPDMESFLKEITELYVSKSGERGIFSRVACQSKVASTGRRDSDFEFGTNPCSEIILRPQQFCNLSEVIVRPGDSIKLLERKVRLASILGTLQSSLISFKLLGKAWTTNCEEERLLGVSLTGIMDHPRLSGRVGETATLSKDLETLRDIAIDTNAQFCGTLGIGPSTAVTCVKPSGTVSQLCNTASGIHPRYASTYIRRVRNDNKDPITQWLKDQGVAWEIDATNEHCTVFGFPMQSPEGAITTDEISAIDHLKLWQLYNDHWCEHKPSVTIQYRPEEFLELAGFIYDNFDSISGIALLPRDDHTYVQAPYEKIDEDTYKELAKDTPDVLDWEKLQDYETEDNTSVQPELACVGGACEL